MTTMVKIEVTSLHEGKMAEVHYAFPADGHKMGLAARLYKVGDTAVVACHTGADLVVSEVPAVPAA